MTNEQREIHRKKRVLEHAERMGNVNKTCRYFGVARSTFYLWRARYRELGDEGLKSRRCCAHDHPNKTPDGVVDKILHLRRTYHMGPMRIVWYLERYLDIKTSDATVYRVCKRHGLNRLPNRVGRRAVHTHRYEKQVPGHHVQVDVKFLTLPRKKGAPVRRYQYTAIDDATRIRALKIYRRHTQANAIDFIDYVVAKFPFRIRTIRTDRGHEFHHWYRNRLLSFSPESLDPVAEERVWTLNQIQAEGVADQLDKRPWLLDATIPPSKPDDYVRRYRSALEATPELLETLDSLLIRYGKAEDSDKQKLGKEISALVPLSGHPTGFFMANLIQEQLGLEALRREVGNPFAFIRLFNQAAEEANRHELAFSPPALALLAELERAQAQP